MDSTTEAHGNTPELRMVLVGKIGVGKSASGNTILGKKEFNSKTSDSSVTKVCEKREVVVSGRQVVVVDTPAFSTESVECIALSAPAPHAILLVIEVGRFTDEDKRTVEAIQRRFGVEAERYMMVLFSHKDKLEDETIEEFIQGASKELRDLVEKCGGRYHSFNNKEKSDCTQVTELLEKIDRMVKENEGSCYTSDMITQRKNEEENEEEMECQEGASDKPTDSEAHGKAAPGSSTELRMVLVGKTGVGKSASGNTILGKKEFNSKTSDSSVTKVCEKREVVVSGRQVVVVDTPAFSTEAVECITVSAPGPHAILLVIEVGRFTDEDQRTVEAIQRRFGVEAERYMMVLFSHKDKLEDETIEEFIQGASKELRDLVEKCGGRYHSFNNKEKSDCTQVTELLEKIDRMVKENEGSCYTSDMITQRKNEEENEEEMECQEGASDKPTDSEAHGKAAPGSSTELRMVLVGKTGVGKSASGNTILGKKEFNSKTSDSSVTKVCEKREVVVSGRQVVVVDTPAFSTEAVECITVSAPGPHAILLVIEVGRFTDEDQRTVEAIQRRFGVEAERYMMVLFSHKDKLEDETIEEFIQGASKELRDLVEKCGGRYHSFNNKEKSDCTQVTELLEKIDRMVKENEGSCYTSDMITQRKIEEENKEEMECQEGASDKPTDSGSLSRSKPQASNMRHNTGSLSRSKPQASNMRHNTGSLSSSTPQASNMSVNAELRIVLLGKTGVGKSAAGNTILGRKEFDSKLSSTSITNKCKKGTAVVAGRHIAVIDTPGLFGTELTADQIKQEIENCVSLSAPGPHALLLVLQVGRYTEREAKAVKIIFGESAARYLMVLFTHGDSLEDGMTIEKYIEGVEGDLQQLIDECGGRYHVFNNKDKSNTAQALDLVKEIEMMVETNCGRYYTMEMYNKAAASTSQKLETKERKERSQNMKMESNSESCYTVNASTSQKLERKERSQNKTVHGRRSFCFLL